MTTKYKHAKEKAEELRKQYALPTPVHVFELADMLGIKWSLCDSTQLEKILAKEKITPAAEDKHDVLAFYNKPENTFYINNETQPITRKRFTMAHEIAHLTLHANRPENHYRKAFLRQDITNPQDQTETEANYFAGYLLMPDEAIEQKLPYTSLMLGGESIIQEFAKMFAVSPDAMRIRFRTFKQENPELWKQYEMEEKLF